MLSQRVLVNQRELVNWIINRNWSSVMKSQKGSE